MGRMQLDTAEPSAVLTLCTLGVGDRGWRHNGRVEHRRLAGTSLDRWRVVGRVLDGPRVNGADVARGKRLLLGNAFASEGGVHGVGGWVAEG